MPAALNAQPPYMLSIVIIVRSKVDAILRRSPVIDSGYQGIVIKSDG